MPTDLHITKELHIKLLANTHAELKVRSCRLKLSMQAVVDELVKLVVEDDPYIARKLNEAYRRRREKQAAALMDTDADSLLDRIEELEVLS